MNDVEQSFQSKETNTRLDEVGYCAFCVSD